jgi:hypothetical protein
MLRSISSAVTIFLLLSHAAAAQQERVEAWGGLNLVRASLDTNVTTQYLPQIQSYSPPLAGSTAGQTVQVQAGNTAGLGGGLNVFFSRHVGVQFLFGRDNRDLTGANGDYSFLLNYTAMQPPDYVPRNYSTSRTFTACDASQSSGCVLPTSGTLRQTTLGFNVVGRWQAGRRVNAEVSGGLSSYRVASDDAGSLRYSGFNMGGHSTLFGSEYQLGYSIGPARGYGFNAGATFDVSIGRGVALTADARYFAGAEISSPIVVTKVTNADTITLMQDLATIQRNLHPPDAQIKPSRFHLLVGLKVRM